MPLVELHHDDGDVVRNHAPTDPAFHAGETMMETAVQPPSPPQLADPAFDPVAETPRGPEPGLMLPATAACALVARLGQAPPPHASRASLPLVLRRINAPVTAQFARRFPK